MLWGERTCGMFRVQGLGLWGLRTFGVLAFGSV